MSDSGGSNALKGFVYQFLHTLMALMDGGRPVKVRPDQPAKASGNGQRDLLIQVEGYEDLDMKSPDSLRLYQLKDCADFGPASFADEVLPRFATEYVALKCSNPEFVLFTSAKLDGIFYGPFRALCTKARELREQGKTGTATDLSFRADLGTDPIRAAEAAAWASKRGRNGKPVKRRLPKTDSVGDFLAWLLQCLLVREAGIADEAELLDFLSRVEIDDGHEWGRLRGRVLKAVQTRLPVDTAEERLEGAVGVLVLWAAEHGGEWVEAGHLLQRMRIPLREVTWGAVHAGCAVGAPVRDLPGGERAHVEDDAANFGSYVRPWVELNESPLFVLATVGQVNTQWLTGTCTEAASLYAPVVVVDCAANNDGDIARRLLSMAGWQGVSANDWPLPTLLERLRDSPDRPRDRPSSIVVATGFLGEVGHVDRLSRWLDLVTGTRGLLLLVADEAMLSRLGPQRCGEWAPLVWQPSGPPAAGNGVGRLPVSYRLVPSTEDPALALRQATARIAYALERTEAAVSSTLDSVAAVAIDEAPGSGMVPSDELAHLPCWDWSSEAADALPKAAINEGLFGSRGNALLLRPVAATAALVRRTIGSMQLPDMVEFSGRLAGTPLTSGAVFDGFLLWLADFVGSGSDENDLLAVLRPWAQRSHWRWTRSVFGTAGRGALGPLRLLAEELADRVAEEDVDAYAAAATLRHLLDFARATGAPDLADWALEWTRETDSDWLRHQIMSFFAPDTGEEGLEGLLAELRIASGGGIEE